MNQAYQKEMIKNVYRISRKHYINRFIERPELIKKWYESKLISRNPGAAIVGSSNFTKRGLVSNTELNVSITDARTICELDEWFDRIWKDSEDFRDGLIKIINISDIENKKRTSLGICISPFELFKVFAYELLDGRIKLTKERQILVLFQEIGVINVIKKMKKYYGALISDSVGLGKSFIGSQIIKDYFYNRIDFWDKNLKDKWLSIGKGVLLIVPAHIKKQWKEDVLMRFFFSNCILKNIDGDYHFRIIDKELGVLGEIKIISYSKFTRLKQNDKDSELSDLSNRFDVILIDEAHRFRDSDTNAWKNVQFLKKKPDYTFESGKGVIDNIRNRFMLLSATPLNNRISDLENIFGVFLDRDFRDLARQGLDARLFQRYRQIRNELKKTPTNITLINKLKDNIKKIKEILDELMLLRTRTYISSEYKGIKLNNKKLKFIEPTVKKVKYDANLEEYYNEYLDLYLNLSIFLQKLELPYIDLFEPDEKKKFNVRILFKILLLKRMESSIYAFEKSIKKINEKEGFLLNLVTQYSDIEKIREEWIKVYKRTIKDEIEIAEEFSNEIHEMVENRGEKERVEIDLEELENHLKNDLKLIEQYSRLIEKVKIKTNPIEYKDPKLKELKLLLNGYFENGSKIPKILIFSQFKDTVHYIFDKIKEWDTYR